MNFQDWYTDTVDVWRVISTTVDGLTTQERKPVHTGIPCRIYRSDNRPIQLEQTAAYVEQSDKLMCDTSADIRAGDQLIIHRGERLGKCAPTIRAFAADPNLYYEPFGAVVPGLAHMEVPLLQKEHI